MKVITTCFAACIVLTACGPSQQTQSSTPTQSVAANTEQQSTAPDFISILEAAKRGEYQSQRNLAYGYAAHPYPGQEKNRVLGCAWYLVVLNSDHPQLNIGDETNVQTYCGGLDKDLLETSKYRAEQFLGEIKATRNLAKKQ